MDSHVYVGTYSLPSDDHDAKAQVFGWKTLHSPDGEGTRAALNTTLSEAPTRICDTK